MDASSIIKLILGTSFLGLMILTGIYNDEPFFKVILAVLITFGSVYGIGQLPYAFLIFIILGITIYTYVQTTSIEDTLFNTLLVFTVCILLGFFGDADFFKPFRALNEGFYFSSSARRLVGHSMTSLQCQNACASDKHCKFSYYSRSMDRGARGQCWNTYGSDANQRPYGGKDKGGITWRNRKYTPKPPPPPKPPKVIRIYKQPTYKKLNGHCTGGSSYRRYPENNVYACQRRCNATAGCKGFAFFKGRQYLPPLKDGPCTTYNKCIDSRDNVNWGYDIYQRN